MVSWLLGFLVGMGFGWGSVSGFQVSAPDRDHLQFRPSLQISTSRDEVVSAVIRWGDGRAGQSRCRALLSQFAPFRLRYYRMESYRVLPEQRSFVGSKAGEYWDPLVPVSQICRGDLVWVDIETPRGVRPGNYSLPYGIQLKVWKMIMPGRPSLPLYIHLNSHAVFSAHGLEGAAPSRLRISALKKYIRLYREHRIEPYGQYPGFYPPFGGRELKRNGTAERASFRELVLKGAIAPPILFTPNFDVPPGQVLLKAIDGALERGELPLESLAYVWDEGENDPRLTRQSLIRARWVRRYAPRLKILMTRVPTVEFEPFVDLVVALQNRYRTGWMTPYGLYVSCVSQGSCQNGIPRKPTGPPMMVVDAPTVSPRAFLWVNEMLGAQVGLYYNATEKLSNAWRDQYCFGGNGDGTLLYPDRSRVEPNGSIRLKMLRQGSYDVEYLRWAKRAGMHWLSPVTDQNHWSQNWGDYQRLRNQLGETLSAK